jgi:hypothetical protein
MDAASQSRDTGVGGGRWRVLEAGEAAVTQLLLDSEAEVEAALRQLAVSEAKNELLALQLSQKDQLVKKLTATATVEPALAANDVLRCVSAARVLLLLLLALTGLAADDAAKSTPSLWRR